MHGGKVPSGPDCVHFRHGRRTRAADQESQNLSGLAKLMRLVEKLPPGAPVTPEIVELELDLRARFEADDERRAQWRRILEDQGRRN